VRFAPIGTISDPAGTYGAIIIDNAAVYPPDADDFCSCLSGNVSIDAACRYLKSSPTATSSGSREEVCKNNFVLRPSDAVVLIGCTPPKSKYFGLQTNVSAPPRRHGGAQGRPVPSR